jgi:hypothetical protein
MCIICFYYKKLAIMAAQHARIVVIIAKVAQIKIEVHFLVVNALSVF